MKYKNKKQYRLKNYNYSWNGAYFVTICAKDRKEIFGKIEGIKSIYSLYGKIIKDCWLDTPNHFTDIRLDEWIIMPNHFHGIIEILECRNRACPVPATVNINNLSSVEAKFGKVSKGSLSVIIGSFKSAVTKTINRKYPGNIFAWQSRYFDRVIRNEKELDKIRKYIIDNPVKWGLDRNNPVNL